MATTATFDFADSGRHETGVAHAAITLVASTLAPLGLFGLVHWAAASAGLDPLYFAPFGLPGWVGAFGHLVQLALLGIAFWAVARNAADRRAGIWLAAFTTAFIILPFVTPWLDSLQLSILCTTLFLFGLAGANRVGKVSPLAGWLMTPTLAIVGLSATMGLVISAAYTPPFALVQGQQAA